MHAFQKTIGADYTRGLGRLSHPEPASRPMRDKAALERNLYLCFGRFSIALRLVKMIKNAAVRMAIDKPANFRPSPNLCASSGLLVTVCNTMTHLTRRCCRLHAQRTKLFSMSICVMSIAKVSQQRKKRLLNAGGVEFHEGGSQ